ncbi:MAG TPA: hypothetical protein VGH27_06505 [Streptosporangiaceae bacterium]
MITMHRARGDERSDEGSDVLLGEGPHTTATRLDQEERETTRPPVATERITVALIPKVVEDLRRLQQRTGLSKTDVANRSVSLYEFIDAQLRAGRDVLIRDNESGESQIVRLL